MSIFILVVARNDTSAEYIYIYICKYYHLRINKYFLLPVFSQTVTLIQIMRSQIILLIIIAHKYLNVSN